MSGIPSRRNSSYGSSSSGNSASSRSTPKTAQSIRRSQSMRYAQRHGSNLSNSTLNGTATPLNRARRVASIPANIANTNTDKALNAENDYKNDYNSYNNKNSVKTNGKSENLFNFIIAKDLDHFKNEKVFRVLVVGSQDSGKSSLVSQFSYFLEDQRQLDSDQKSQYLILNFRELNGLDNSFPRSPITLYSPDAYIIAYAVNDRDSFEGAKRVIHEIHKWDDFELKPVILVANKTDLVRSRTVTKQEGRQLAMANNCKYIETSCAISHNIDFLLTGIGAQINLKNNPKSGQTNSTRKPNLFKRLLRKAALNKSKSCDNLHVL